MSTNTNVIGITTSIDTNFFNYWIRFLLPIHKLSDKEMGVLSSLVKERFLLSLVISDENILNKVLFSDGVKKKIIKELGTKDYCFNNILSKLRKKKIVINNVINAKLIPYISTDTDTFKLIIHFKLLDEKGLTGLDNRGSKLGE